MRNTHKKPIWLALALVAMLSAGNAAAADKAAKDPSRRLQQQLRAVEQEKAKLAQQMAEREAQVKDMEDKLAESQRLIDAAAAKVTRLNKELAGMRDQVAAGKAEQAALTAKLADAERKTADLKQTFGVEKQQLESAAARQRTNLAACSERNARMYKLGNELLDKYEAKSCLSSVLQAEPFTGLKRAQVEKMIEEDREKLDKDQLNP